MSADKLIIPRSPRISELETQFLTHCQAEWQFGKQTIERYGYCLRRLRRAIGDLPVTEIRRDDVMKLKVQMISMGNSESWQVVMLSVTKRLLEFCREPLALAVLEPATITVPTRPYRKVIYLTPKEVHRFISVIPIRTLKNRPHHHGLRFRALVEVLLGTAMRIGEVLSLNRSDIDFERREARVIGKGNKERTVFFTDRALHWLSQYLEIRTDDEPPLFVAQDGRTRLNRVDIWRPFARYRKLAGLNKPVRPHLLRHTAATQLLFNGCPVSHIKDILGHARLETTCRYYLGLDLRAAKLAHQQYLVYDAEE